MPVRISRRVPSVTPPPNGAFFDSALRYPLHCIVISFNEHTDDLCFGLTVHDALQRLVFAATHIATVAEQPASAMTSLADNDSRHLNRQ